MNEKPIPVVGALLGLSMILFCAALGYFAGLAIYYTVIAITGA